VTGPRPPVVAGLTGGREDTAVLTAAATHALLHHHPLHLVSGSGTGDPTVHLGRAAAQVRRTRPSLTTTTEGTGRSLTELLAALSADAACVVTDRGTGQRVVNAVRCPLLSVTGPTVSRSGPVLVPLDVTGDGNALLEHGFAEAQARGLPLRVVFAWTAPLIASMYPTSAIDLLAVHGDIDRELAERLAGWSQKYPDVVVERDEIRCHDILTTLVRAVAGAGFVAVGTRTGPVVGPVTRAVLTTARCAVLAVPVPGAN
jgi:hypothetical protein